MIDFTPVAVSAVGGLMTIIGSVFLVWLQAHMKDQAAALTIGNAVQNALGEVKQAADAGLASHPLQATIPGITPAAAAGVQYVLNNAGPELARFTNITPALIAQKIEARIGLAKGAPVDTAVVTVSPVVAAPLVGSPGLAVAAPVAPAVAQPVAPAAA